MAILGGIMFVDWTGWDDVLSRLDYLPVTIFAFTSIPSRYQVERIIFGVRATPTAVGVRKRMRLEVFAIPYNSSNLARFADPTTSLRPHIPVKMGQEQ